MRLALLAALVLAAPAAFAADAPKPSAKLTTSQFAKSFVCPEALPSDARRQEETKRFMDWVVETHPNWTTNDVVEHRMALLMAHGCVKTLQSIRQAGGR